MIKKHYNETELQYELKTYIQIKLKELTGKLSKEQQTLLLPKLLPNIKEVVEKNIEICEYRIKFYQTQLNNTK